MAIVNLPTDKTVTFIFSGNLPHGQVRGLVAVPVTGSKKLLEFGTVPSIAAGEFRMTCVLEAGDYATANEAGYTQIKLCNDLGQLVGPGASGYLISA